MSMYRINFTVRGIGVNLNIDVDDDPEHYPPEQVEQVCRELARRLGGDYTYSERVDEAAK